MPSGFRTAADMRRASRLSMRIRSANPFITTVSSPTSHMCPLISHATTRSAPARAASIDSSPEPAPTSSASTSSAPNARFRSTAFRTAASYAPFRSSSRTMSKCHRGTWACLGRARGGSAVSSSWPASCQTLSATGSPGVARPSSRYCTLWPGWAPAAELSATPSASVRSYHVPTAFQGPSAVAGTASPVSTSHRGRGASASAPGGPAESASARRWKSMVRTSNGADTARWPTCESS